MVVQPAGSVNRIRRVEKIKVSIKSHPSQRAAQMRISSPEFNILYGKHGKMCLFTGGTFQLLTSKIQTCLSPHGMNTAETHNRLF